MNSERNPGLGPRRYDAREGSEAYARVVRFISLHCGPLVARQTSSDENSIPNGAVLLYVFKGNRLCLDDVCLGISKAAYPARSEVCLVRYRATDAESTVQVTLYYPRLTYARLYTLLAVLALLVAVGLGTFLEFRRKLSDWQLEHSPPPFDPGS